MKKFLFLLMTLSFVSWGQGYSPSNKQGIETDSGGGNSNFTCPIDTGWFTLLGQEQPDSVCQLAKEKVKNLAKKARSAAKR